MILSSKGNDPVVIVKVTFKIPTNQDLDSLTKKFMENADMYRSTEGLIRKNYICDIENSLAGGIYCFDTRVSAEKWFDDERIKWLEKRYSKPDIQYFENPIIVDNKSGEITY